MRKRIYISGPISNGGKATPVERLQNVVVACSLAANLMDRGFSILCPQLTEYMARTVGRDFAHDVWMENDFPWVEVADAILRMPGQSLGSDMEVEHAHSHSVPVFYTIEQLENWRRELND
jgi:hypothetical protein